VPQAPTSDDDVTCTTVIPEPTSLALLAAGGLLAIRWPR